MTKKMLIWAHTALQELDSCTGFVSCDTELAQQLLDAGKVQDPRIGGRALLRICTDAPVYQDKQMKAAAPVYQTKQLQAASRDKNPHSSKRGK